MATQKEPKVLGIDEVHRATVEMHLKPVKGDVTAKRISLTIRKGMANKS